ncbi:unnamed protein product [Lactuca virosa]|uniref:Uncharacterized protein n=1 Tax=Lactuca virosa TaxID=75947 RepID=A0AAU9LI17_9ASTR|nr:unnamed protein product [Lactuca virosa]
MFQHNGIRIKVISMGLGAEQKWLFILFTAAIISLLLFISSIFGFSASYASHKSFSSTVHRGTSHPPSFSYYISGTGGDADRIFRLLLTVYHPRNRYLLHIGTEGSVDERKRLAELVKSVPVIRAFDNVHLIQNPDPTTEMGASNIAAILHAAAILLKNDGDWDWFITLSASDYPLLTQDDLFHAFSSISRDANFIDHTSDLGWKQDQRIQPIVVDPGIYLARRTQIFRATEKRPMPDAFKVFTGSPWVILSRSFLEYCVFAWDNLPRTLLMYVNNIVLAQEVYFHTVICNSPEFKNTTINNDLRFMAWDKPRKMEPIFLKNSNYKNMVESGAAFARRFDENDAVLDMIDSNILTRKSGRVAPGVWCTGHRNWFMDPCSHWGDVNVLKRSHEGKKFDELIKKMVDDSSLQLNQCK